MTAEEERKAKSDIEIDPSKLKEELSTEINGNFTKFKEAQDEQMKPVLSFVEEMRKEREDRKKAEEDNARREAAKNEEVGEEAWLLDPSKAVEAKLKPTQLAVLSLAANQARRDTLDDKEYYYGDIKTKVDQMIEAQPLNQRVSKTVIENCYKLVMFDHQKDIAEGKIKARNNSASFESTGTGAHSSKSGEHEEEMSQDEKQAASALGVSEADWKKTKKELTYV
jgi:hypothetical protein